MTAAWRFLVEQTDTTGVVFRGYRDETDFVGMCGALNAACAADGLERVENPEVMARSYTRLDNSDIDRDVTVVEKDGEIVGYGRVLWWESYDGARRYLPFCFLRPDVRGRGIGSALLAHNEARLREIAADHPADGERTLEVFAADTEEAAHALFQTAGYQPARYEANMIRTHLDDIVETPLPEGLEIRTPTADEMRKVFDAAVEAFSDHIDAAPATENDFLEFRDFEWFDPTLWRVAWDGDEVAGQVRSFINERENAGFGRLRGWTEEISVRRPYRRAGLARALLTRSLAAVRDRGMTEAALGVATENLHGAFRLYESVGFEQYRLWTTYRKPI